MPIFKELSPADIHTSVSSLNQLVDVIQEDVSGSTTRRKYQVFVTGGFNVGPGVTSSLYQTVYDQDFTLQTSNPIFDMTVGLYWKGEKTGLQGAGAVGSPYPKIYIGPQTNGKMLFQSSSLMMREKMDVYSQFAQTLLGDSSSPFFIPHDSTAASNTVECALFVCFKRLFSRDKLKRETFAMRMYTSAAISGMDGYAGNFENSGTDGGSNNYSAALTDTTGSNLWVTSQEGAKIFTDKGSATSQASSIPAGAVGKIVDASNISKDVGTIFYDQGIVMLDLARVAWADQHMSGVLRAMNPNTVNDVGIGYTLIGSGTAIDDVGSEEQWGNRNASFIPDFVVSASIDDIVDHIASTRFQSGSLTAMTFQNVTNINSTLFFCRASPDEFNYSSNPSFTDASDRITVIDSGAEEEQRTFTFPTTVGLYDSLGNLLAVAKTSRPVEKNDEKDMTFRVRLDF